jgi:hypothetical protein
MSNLKLPGKSAALSIAFITSLCASAQTIYTIDFDTNQSQFSQNFIYSDVTPSGGYIINHNDINTQGAGGTSGGAVSFSTVGLDTASYIFVGRGATNTPTPGVATSNNMADYSVTFDVKAVGLTGSTAFAQFSIYFDNGSVGRDSTTFLVTNSFTTISLPLSSFSGGYGIFNGATTINGGGSSVQIQANNPGGDFGYDTGNQLIYDNIVFAQNVAIPEPSSITALAGIFALACVALRRRPSH